MITSIFNNYSNQYYKCNDLLIDTTSAKIYIHLYKNKPSNYFLFFTYLQIVEEFPIINSDIYAVNSDYSQLSISTSRYGETLLLSDPEKCPIALNINADYGSTLFCLTVANQKSIFEGLYASGIPICVIPDQKLILPVSTNTRQQIINKLNKL